MYPTTNSQFQIIYAPELYSKKINHSSGLALILNIIGAIAIIGGIVMLFLSIPLNENPIIFILSIIVSISGLLFFAMATMVYELQLHSKILLAILDKKEN